MGEAAHEARRDGWALPLQGEDQAFTGCQIWLRDADGITSLSVAAAGVGRWAAGQADPIRDKVELTLERLARPVTLPPGCPPQRPLIMGVVNVTPDSFSDGGRFLAAQAAIEHGRKLWSEGAAIIDVGGESTRPGSQGVPADEELRRVLPVVQTLAREGIYVSIDTRKSPVMAAALEAGARMINDISALRYDPDSVGLVAAKDVPVVLMHSQGEPATMQEQPAYQRAPLDVCDHLDARLDACEAAGIDRSRLIVDPGIGFGKTVAHNLEILHHIGLFAGLGAGMLLGVSRKSFIARVAGEAPPDRRLGGSLAAALFGYAEGALILRVHDVAETAQAVRLWNGIRTAR